MFGFFVPRFLKDGRELLKGAEKMLAYQKDILRPEDRATFEADISRLSGALKSRDAAAVEAAGTQVEQTFERIFPPRTHDAIRENCEVFLVAIVIAIGVRTYFLQPFTIPTGSMQPTLNGIIAHNTGLPRPNALTRTMHLTLLGRSYIDLVSERDDVILSITERPWLRFFTVTDIECQHQKFTVFSPANKLPDFNVYEGRILAKGETIARGHVDAGDHVFVDKMAYNVRKPHRGEVFVFSTAGVPTNENVRHPGGPSQFYIKRLGGLPDDVLRIDPPNLFVNGKRAEGRGFERVMSAKDGYRGYSNGPAGGSGFRFLGSPNAEFHVGDYFALGDNSYYSSDSRDWGVVPEQNLMGRGLFVYWPFNSHWGLIR